MSFIKIHNTKIFQNPTEIATSIYRLQKKQLENEFLSIDTTYRRLDNVFIIQYSSDHTILQLHGNILLESDHNIYISSLKKLGYTSGQPCEISFQYKSADIPSNSENIQTTTFKLTGFIISAKTEIISNRCCNLLNLIIGIPVNGNDKISQLKYYLSSLTESRIFTFRCRPSNHIFFNSEEEAELELSRIWQSKHTNSLSHQFIQDYYTDDRIETNTSNLDLYDIKNLDSEQVQLISDICSDTKLITCIAPAGTGKTESICGSVINGIKLGKKFLIICPTINSCDAFLERLLAWKPNLQNVLILRPIYALSKCSNMYKRTEHYYFNEGLNSHSKSMTSYDNNILNRYIICKKHYVNLQTYSTTCWTQEYIDELGFVINDMSNTEKLLPRLIMKYIKPQIIISTIDMINRDLSADYINKGFDNIIIDDASLIRTSTALYLHSIFPNSNICYVGDLNHSQPYEFEDISLDKYEKLLASPILEIMNHNKLSLNLHLSNNYRSHPQIVKMLTSLFYNGLLDIVCHDLNYLFDGINFPNILNHPTKRIFKTIPFYLIDIPHNSHNNFTSMDYHYQEATNISILLLSLYETGVIPNKISIICLCENQVNPISKTYYSLSSSYAKRLNNINSKFPETNYTITINNILQPINIGTIEDFQGNDNDYIIISTTSYNNGSSNTITQSNNLKNKICMALTRAKKGFFMFGNTDLMKNNEDWYNFYKYMSKNNAITNFTTTSVHTIARVSGELTHFIIDTIKK